MKPFTNPEHFAFTNYFNKSLLQRRIFMMNKTHSTWKTFGKYLLLLPAFFIVFSFSKPYILTTTPTKYLVQTDEAIEWVITPKITMEDLAKIREIVEAHGGEFYTTSYQLDPLQFFVQQLATEQSSLKNSGASIEGNPYALQPIRCSLYRFDLKNKQIYHYYHKEPISAQLRKVALEDRKETEQVFKNHSLEYELREIQNRRGFLWENIHYLTTSPFPKPQPIFFRVLEGKSTSIWKDNVLGKEIVKEALKHAGAITRVNKRPMAHEDLAQLDAKTIKDAFIFDIYDEKKNYDKKTYVLVHTIP